MPPRLLCVGSHGRPRRRGGQDPGAHTHRESGERPADGPPPRGVCV